MRVGFLGWEDPLEEGLVTHSSIIVWEIPWTEEPGGLQSIALQGVRHNWETACTQHNSTNSCCSRVNCSQTQLFQNPGNQLKICNNQKGHLFKKTDLISVRTGSFLRVILSYFRSFLPSCMVAVKTSIPVVTGGAKLGMELTQKPIVTIWSVWHKTLL